MIGPFPSSRKRRAARITTGLLAPSRHRGRTDIILTRRVGKDTTLFLTSVKGDLEKAVLAKDGQTMQNIEASAAASDFDTEKAFWLDTWLKDFDARHPAKPPAKK